MWSSEDRLLALTLFHNPSDSSARILPVRKSLIAEHSPRRIAQEGAVQALGG